MFLRHRRQCEKPGFHVPFYLVHASFGRKVNKRGKQLYKCKKEVVRGVSCPSINQTWKKEFLWVEFYGNKKEMFCAVCRTHASVCDKSGRLFLSIGGSVVGVAQQSKAPN